MKFSGKPNFKKLKNLGFPNSEFFILLALKKNHRICEKIATFLHTLDLVFLLREYAHT